MKIWILCSSRQRKKKTSPYLRATVKNLRSFNVRRTEHAVNNNGKNLYCRGCLGKDHSIESCPFVVDPAKLARICDANYQQQPTGQYGSGYRASYQRGFQAPYNGNNQYEKRQNRTHQFILNSRQNQQSFMTQDTRRTSGHNSPTILVTKAPNA